MKTLEEDIRERHLWNPFDFANPVNDGGLFSGRSRELEDIKYYLNLAGKAPRAINLALSGARSSGKTSLLNKIDMEANRSGFCVVRVDLNESDASPNKLFFKIYDSLLTAAVHFGAFAGPKGPIYSEYRSVVDQLAAGAVGELAFPRHYALSAGASNQISEATFKNDLGIISKEIGTACVILFDECDVLSTSRVELQMLRNTFMNTPGYMLVMSGTPKMFPAFEDVFSPILRQFKKIPVLPFEDQAETRQCVERPLVSQGISPSSAFGPRSYFLFQEIHKLSGGRPYEIQLLCHFMFKRVEEGRASYMEVNLDVLDEVRLELEDQERGTGRRSIEAIDSMTHSQLQSLSVLAACPATVNELQFLADLMQIRYPGEDIDSALEYFVEIGILKVAESIVRFNGDQFDEIYLRYYAASKKIRFSGVGDSFFIKFASRFNIILEDMSNRKHEVIPDYAYSAVSSSADDAIEKATEVISSLTDEPGEERRIADLAEFIYPLLVVPQLKNELTLVAVQAKVFGYETSVVVAHHDRDELGDWYKNAYARAEEVIRTYGGSIDSREQVYADIDTSVVLACASRYASTSLRAHFAEAHRAISYESFENGEYEEALGNARAAHLLSPNSASFSMVIHLGLYMGEYESVKTLSAEVYKINDIEQLLMTGKEDELAFAIYNGAIANFMSGSQTLAAEMFGFVLRTGSQIQEDGFFMVPESDPSGEVVLCQRQQTFAESVSDTKASGLPPFSEPPVT